jgi:hypothetical protein
MINSWPWTLTPLTARVVGAMFALGLTALGWGRTAMERCPPDVAGADIHDGDGVNIGAPRLG